MELAAIGINHNTAQIALRERVAFPAAIISGALRRLALLPGVREAVIVSTCNRTEVYLGFSGTPPASGEGIGRQETMLGWLAGFHGIDVYELRPSSYFHEDGEAVRHLMQVAAGLDSMVLGEPQILGQIKSAHALSRELRLVGGNLARAFDAAFSVAKEVRTETAIGASPVSVAYAAVTLAERIFSDLPSLRALLVGAGRTIELAARHLAERKVRGIVIANRTLDNALQLAEQLDGELAAQGALLSELPELLVDADIVISSTNSQLPLIGKGMVERATRQRKHRPILLVDLAVPRDIEVEAGEIPDAYLYGIDDIGNVIEDSVASRREAAAEAAAIIERGMARFLDQLRSRNAVATLRRLRGKADAIREAELIQARRDWEKHGDAHAALESLARAITNKLLHAPSVRMKRASAAGRDELLQATQELFALDEEAPPD